MIQPIGIVNYCNFNGQRKQKMRPVFKGFYDPTCQNIPPSMRVGAKDTIEQFSDKAKEVIEKMKESFFSNLPKDAKETLFQAPSDNSILDSMLSDSMKSFSAKKGLEIVDGSNLVDNVTGVHTHIMPDGTPFSYDDVASAAPIDMAGDAAQSSFHMLDASNFYNPDSGILKHIMPSGDEIPIDLSDVFDNSETATSFFGKMLDVVSDMLDNLPF